MVKSQIVIPFMSFEHSPLSAMRYTLRPLTYRLSAVCHEQKAIFAQSSALCALLYNAITQQPFQLQYPGFQLATTLSSDYAVLSRVFPTISQKRPLFTIA